MRKTKTQKASDDRRCKISHKKEVDMDDKTVNALLEWLADPTDKRTAEEVLDAAADPSVEDEL